MGSPKEEAAQATYKEKIAQRLRRLKGGGPQQDRARDGNQQRQRQERQGQQQPQGNNKPKRGLLPARPKALTKIGSALDDRHKTKGQSKLPPASVAVKHIDVSVDVFTPVRPMDTDEVVAAKSSAPITACAIARRTTDFTIGPIIGVGPYSHVKRAVHIHSKRVCALKCVSKSDVLKARQVEHLRHERTVMMAVKECPFAPELYTTMQDGDTVYFVMEYVPGGELFSHLQSVGRFQEDTAKFFAAQVLLMLEHLHKRDMVYRDLKLENIMLDAQGNIKVIDYGLAKHVGPLNRTFTFCGTPDYLAPEIILTKGHGKAADYWALGVLIYEMIAGYPPFFHTDTLESYKKITEGKVFFPSHVSHTARSLVRGLLQAGGMIRKVDLTKRLGNMCDGAWDVKNNKWFDGMDWVAVLRKELTPPIEIRLEHELDPTYMTVYDRAPSLQREAITSENQAKFNDF